MPLLPCLCLLGDSKLNAGHSALDKLVVDLNAKAARATRRQCRPWDITMAPTTLVEVVHGT